MAMAHKQARAMLTIWGDRMSAMQAASAMANQAQEHAADCDSKNNDDGAAYWQSKRDLARAIRRSLEVMTMRHATKLVDA